MSSEYKIEQLKSLCFCKYCSKLLYNQITLPCNVTICQDHLKDLTNSECQFCNKIHPKDDYKINEISKKILELGVDSIKMSPLFDECKKVFSEAEEKVDEINIFQKGSENFVYEYFEDIKRDVDLRRENLKAVIDNYSDELIEKINKIQKECMDLTKETTDVWKRIEKSKIDLNDLKSKFDSFDFTEDKYNNVLKEINILIPKFENKLEEYKSTILQNKYYSFVFEDIDPETYFGSLKTLDLVSILIS